MPRKITTTPAPAVAAPGPVVIVKTLFTDRELAARWGCSRGLIWKMAKKGDLPPPVHLGTAARWRLEDVVAVESRPGSRT
jgi:predicted DNA-binding transcriptional regulator AlpA